MTRRLGLTATTALVVGNMLGTGVFLLPASLAPFGWNAVLGWLATIAGAMALALVFSKLAARVPGSGGPHAYTRVAFGEGVGFAVAWSYWVNIWVGNAALATASTAYLTVFFPALDGDRMLSTGVTLGAVWLFVLVNLRGVGAAGLVAVVTTVLKLLPLIAVALVGAWVLGERGTAVLTPAPVPLSLGGIAGAATLTMWAFLGVESATVPAGKVRDPERTIPRATLWGTVLTGVVSLAVSSAVMLMADPARLAGSDAPLADFMGAHAGGGWRAPIAAFAAISGFGCLSGWILLQGELPAAMARAGVFPALFAREDARGTPVTAHVLTATLLSAVLLLNARASMVELFTFIATVSVLAALVAYLACACAAIRLRAGGPGFVAVAAFAAAYSVWALAGGGVRPLLWCGALLLAGWPVYAFSRRRGGAGSSPALVDAAAAPPG